MPFTAKRAGNPFGESADGDYRHYQETAQRQDRRSGLCVFAVALFSLPCYAQAAGSPCGNCPGDLNGDKVVNMSDLAIVAANWLRACGDALPVLVVTGQGLSENAAMVLAESLGVPSQQVGYENGVLVFVDPAGFQAVPTTEVTDPQLIQALIRDSADDDAPLSFEAIDFAALGKVKPYDPQRALALFQDALRQVGGLGEGATPQIDHTQFEALDLQGNLLLPAVQIDTRVSYNFAVGSIPVVGPGAQISAPASTRRADQPVDSLCPHIQSG